MTTLIPISERMPADNEGFIWVKRASSEALELAYFTGSEFQDPYTVGDREGLSVEYYTDVTHWAELVPPVDLEKLAQLAEQIGYKMHAEAPDRQEDSSDATGEAIANAIREYKI